MSPEIGLDPGQFYVTGGTMDPDSASYIERRADTELFEALRRHELCYILASRQMGKSSLMARTARRLAHEGVRYAIVDLTIFSEKDGTAEDWYYALIDHISDKLSLRFDTNAWWNANRGLPPLGRLSKFLDRVVLSRRKEHVVIFVDEIDATIRLPFSDDFFASIRACFNARAVKPRFKRLNFVLLGVATPAQLIRDPTRTPFNVGRGIELTDFTDTEAAPLALGLHPDPEHGQVVLQRVLYWTDGHPYLTQALCWYVARNNTWEVDELVRDIFLSRRAAREEPNLRLVRERLTQGEADLLGVLSVYHEIAAGRPVRDETNSPVHASLRLSGVVKTDSGGDLRVRNRIYQTVFSEEWAKSQLPSDVPETAGIPPAVAEAYTTYDILSRLPEFQPLARGILARFFESQRMRDHALLIHLQGLQNDDTKRARRMAANLIDFDYVNLLLSFVHPVPIAEAALSPRGTNLVLAGRDGVARVWSVVSGQPLHALHHRGPVNAVVFSSDGKWLATGCDDHNAYVWNAETVERIALLRHEARVRSVAFDATCTKLISTSADGTARIWDFITGELLYEPLDLKESVKFGAFSPDGASALTVTQRSTAVLWHLLSENPNGLAIPHDSPVTSALFHPVGKAFVTGTEGGIVTAWDVNAAAKMWALDLHSALQAIAFSPDGTLFVCAGADGTATIGQWDSPISPHCRLQHNDAVLAVSFTADGQTVLTASADRSARAWNAADGRPIGSPLRHYGKVSGISSTSDSTKVLTTDQEGTARLWRLESKSGKQLAPITHPARVNAASFLADGGILATGCEDGVVRFFTPTGTPTLAPLIQKSPISAMAFSSVGDLAATGSEDGLVFLWNVEQCRLLDFLRAEFGPIHLLQFSLDGTRLAIGCGEDTVRILDIATSSLSSALQHRGTVRSMMFNADGTRLFSGAADGSARVWSLAEYEEIGTPLTHSSVVTSVGFGPADKGLLLSSGGTSIYIWRFKEHYQESMATGALTRERTLLPDVLFSLDLADEVQYASFTALGNRLVVLTRSWAYCYVLQESGLTHLSSRLLAGPWAGAIHWRKHARVFDVCVLNAGNSVVIQSVFFETPGAQPVSGDHDQLLSEWQWRLGMLVKSNCRLVPVCSTPD